MAGLGLAGLAGAGIAVGIVLASGVAAHPGWLAAQRMDQILAPIAVGLYWWTSRPASRFGLALVALGLISIPLALQSASDPALFTLGAVWEVPFAAALLAVILAFPSGRLGSLPDRAIPLAFGLVVGAASAGRLLVEDRFAPTSPLAACRGACPGNPFQVADAPGLASALAQTSLYATIAFLVAAAAALGVRAARVGARRRRALLIGECVGAVFLLSSAAYGIVVAAAPEATAELDVLRWLPVATRALLAWGFLVALVVAQLHAGRVMRQVVAASLERPRVSEVESLLRGALDDTTLRLGFWVPRSNRYLGIDGTPLDEPEPGSAVSLTPVARQGYAVGAILHESELADDPELVEAAGAAVLLMLENARLEAALQATIVELRHARERAAGATETERRRIERDLHDGAQQQLVALRIKLGIASLSAGTDPELPDRLRALGDELEGALAELRELARGKQPTLLASDGVAVAVEAAARRASHVVHVRAVARGRYAPEVEETAYFCITEALQNVARHAGSAAVAQVELVDEDGALEFSVGDDGAGFDPATTTYGAGIANIAERVRALGGTVTIDATPGGGTRLHGRLPATPAPAAAVERPSASVAS